MRKYWPIPLILCLGGLVLWIAYRPDPAPMPAAESASTGQILEPSQAARQPVAEARAGTRASAPADTPAPWPEDKWHHEFSEEGYRLFHTQADPSLLHGLKVGDQIRFHLPEGHGSVVATITEQRDGLPGTRVSAGLIEGMSEIQGVDVVQGQLDTHITLITEEATWTMVVDNQTGQTIVIDERERVQHQVLSDDDGVEPHVHELPPPPAATP